MINLWVELVYTTALVVIIVALVLACLISVIGWLLSLLERNDEISYDIEDLL